jgi:hypothetical protein
MKSGPGFIELRKIEALREIAETLSKSRNVTYLVCVRIERIEREA